MTMPSLPILGAISLVIYVTIFKVACPMISNRKRIRIMMAQKIVRSVPFR